MEASLRRLAEQLCQRLRARDLAGRSVGIKVRLDDWTNVSRSHTVEQPTNDPAQVGCVALELLRDYVPAAAGAPARRPGRPAFEGETRNAEADDQLRLGVCSR